jgi:hypothetical protein
MAKSRIKSLLEQCVAGGRCEFMTYGEFDRKFQLGGYAPAWANRKILDTASKECTTDASIGGLDLTFLLRNKSTGYPSVVSGQPFNHNNPGPQILRSREEAQRIIDRFAPGTPNPY